MSQAPFVDVSSPILQAYFQGRQVRQEQEKIQQQALERQDLLKQREDEFKRQDKLHRDMMGQALDIHKEEMDYKEKTHQAQMAQHAADAAKQLLEHKSIIAQRAAEFASEHGGFKTETKTMPGSGQQQPRGVIEPQLQYEQGSTQQQALPGVKGMEDVTFDASGMDPRGRLSAEASQNRASQEQIRTDALKFQAQQLKSQDDFRKEQAAHYKVLEQIGWLNASNRSNTSSKSVNNGVQQVLGKIQTDQVYKDYITASNSHDRILELGKNMNGIDDMALLYDFIHNLDNTRVTADEFTEALRSGSSKLESLGLSAKRIFSAGNRLTDEARKKIMAATQRDFGVKMNKYKARLVEGYHQAKRWEPDLTREDFGTLVMHGEKYLTGNPETPTAVNPLPSQPQVGASYPGYKMTERK